MCAQCASNGAAIAGVAAVGGRVWLFALAPSWLGRRARRAVSGLAIVGGVAAATLLT